MRRQLTGKYKNHVHVKGYNLPNLYVFQRRDKMEKASELSNLNSSG